MYELAGKELTGKVAVKLHSGEKGNQNFLGPDFWRPVIEKVGGTVVECNTAYDGARDTTAKHRLLIKEHGWDRYFNVDLMDAEGPDMELAISNGKQIKKKAYFLRAFESRLNRYGFLYLRPYAIRIIIIGNFIVTPENSVFVFIHAGSYACLRLPGKTLRKSRNCSGTGAGNAREPSGFARSRSAERTYHRYTRQKGWPVPRNR